MVICNHMAGHYRPFETCIIGSTGTGFERAARSGMEDWRLWEASAFFPSHIHAHGKASRPRE
jgi:hypothetical protein